MRLERPIGWQLLFWPCAFSSLLASLATSNGPAWAHLALFLIGSIIMRSAGCTLNDIVDRDIDAKVARTAARPIPAGEVSVLGALIFLAVLLFAGLIVLLQFNWFTIGVGASSLILVAIYPFMKRITNWPQLVLGLVFSWGALVGWAAQLGALGWAPLACYVACVAWIVGYDTIYAFQDLEDDALIGIGSTAQIVGQSAPLFVGVCYTLTIVGLGTALALAGSGLLGFGALALAAGHFAWQVTSIRTDDPQLCLRLFKSNHPLAMIIAAGLLVEVLV